MVNADSTTPVHIRWLLMNFHMECVQLKKLKKLQAALSTVRNTLDDKDTPDDISLDDLLKKAKVSYETYIEGLQICCRSNSAKKAS